MLNLNEALFTPVGGPLVLHLPVEALMLVIAIAHELHRVSSDVFSCRVLVDALLVVHKVLKDLQAHKHGSILDKLLLDLFLCDSDGDGARFAVVLVVGCLATICATEGALVGSLLIGYTLVGHGTLDHQVIDRSDKVTTHAPIVLIVTVD